MNKLELNVNGTVVLKSWQITNASELFDLTICNQEILKPWLPWVPKVKTISDSKSFIKESLKEMKSNKGLELGIWQNNKLIGCLGLHGLDLKNNPRPSFGDWLDSKTHGKGIMTQCVKTLINYSFTKLNLNRLEIEAATENIKSYTIAKRLGFTQEGEIREYEFVNGRFLNYYVFSLLQSEWVGN